MKAVDMERLAVADALGKHLRGMTDPRGGAHGAPNLRTRADDELREMYGRAGVDRMRINMGGVQVASLSARMTKPVDEMRLVVDDMGAFVSWLASEDGRDVLEDVVRHHTREFCDAALEQGGQVPPGTRVQHVAIPAGWAGTTLRTDVGKVQAALGGDVSAIVPLLLGGGEGEWA